MKNNPFQNFNTEYTPGERELELLLSQLPSLELSMPNDKVRSPLWQLWAGGVSLAGAFAAIVIYISVSNSGDANYAVNNKVANIDQALATVSNLESVSDPGKF